MSEQPFLTVEEQLQQASGAVLVEPDSHFCAVCGTRVVDQDYFGSRGRPRYPCPMGCEDSCSLVGHRWRTVFEGSRSTFLACDRSGCHEVGWLLS